MCLLEYYYTEDLVLIVRNFLDLIQSSRPGDASNGATTYLFIAGVELHAAYTENKQDDVEVCTYIKVHSREHLNFYYVRFFVSSTNVIGFSGFGD